MKKKRVVGTTRITGNGEMWPDSRYIFNVKTIMFTVILDVECEKI